MVKKTSREKYNLQKLSDPKVLKIYAEKLHKIIQIGNSQKVMETFQRDILSPTLFNKKN